MADSVNAVKTSHAAYMTSVEKDMLVEIALKYENKIKNKRMNAFSVCQKATAWTNIATVLNAAFSHKDNGVTSHK